MIRKLLFQNQDKKQLVIAIIGALLGITFLVTSIHYLIRVNEFGKGSEILGPNTIIVQKKVNNSAVFGLAKTDFTEAEIEKMKAEKFIEDVQPVVSNNFNVWFETNDPMVPTFKSDIFIQTVDPKFLDVKSKSWKWANGDKFVPMIMPRDFIVMLNTFMSSSGIPQISDDVAMDIKFRLAISNGAGKEYVDARIIGFTNEVASILVPQSFMEYGNQKYALEEDMKITQVMISSKENEFGLVEEMLAKRGLESKNSQMVVGRLKSMVGTLILVILGVSIVAVLAAGLVLIQYLQLLISRNDYEVRTLLRIGYHPKLIIRAFFLYFVKIFGIVSFLGLVVFFLLKFLLDSVFESGGLYINTTVSIIAILALLLAYVIFAYSSYKTAKNGIFKEY